MSITAFTSTGTTSLGDMGAPFSTLMQQANRPVMFVAVIGNSEGLAQVPSYLPAASAFRSVESHDNLGVAIVPAEMADFTVDRLASGMYWASAHTTWDEAVNDLVRRAA